MKARIVIATRGYRLVRSGHRGMQFTLERPTGKRDALGVMCWERVSIDDPEARSIVNSLVDSLGRALVHREKRLARNRRARHEESIAP